MQQILLIEDEAVLARNIARTLEKVGMKVVHAPSASAACSVLSKGTFDLIIADISLGDGDGLEVIAQFSEDLHETPVIVMTGQDSPQNRSRAEVLPVAAFLSKPFALSRMRELVTALVRSGNGGSHSAPGPSVVMYSHDSIGLGHMRRNSAIAKEMVSKIPGVSILMIVGCPVGMMFEPHPGIDYVKLPSLSKLGRGVYEAGSLRIDAQRTRDMRTRIIEGVLGSIRPDLLLVDHEPAGAMDELKPVLESLRFAGHTCTVLGLRDILDDPARTRAAWSKAGTDHLITDFYDHVLVYGDDEFFPTRRAYGLDTLKPGAVTTCGIVTTVRQSLRSTSARPPRHVLVSGGGGRDAYPLVEAAISAFATIPHRRRPKMTVVTGPLMDTELKLEAQQTGLRNGVQVLEHVTDMPSLMASTDLLITMTGYNSINEALTTDCPVVTVPRLGPSAEQRLRAEALEQHGLARYLRREALTPQNLAKLIMQVPPPLPAKALNADGVRNAADALANLIKHRQEAGKEVAHG